MVAMPPVFLGVSHKMYFDPQQTLSWSRAVADMARRSEAIRSQRVSLVVLPSLPVLASVVDVFAGAEVQVGAQDLFHEDRGAFTGAVSAYDLRQIGCGYAEIGHAERRAMFGDDDRIVRLKVAAAIRNGLTPILCIGEPQKTSREAAQAWCLQQLESALGWLVDERQSVPLVVAYEPVWAIGQSRAADDEHLQFVIPAIRDWLQQRPSVADARLIYGGSAGPGTLTRLAGLVDGLFLGRFAHDLAALAAILGEADDLTTVGVHPSQSC